MTSPDNDVLSAWNYDTGMVTRIRKHARRRLYLAEWREHLGVTAEQMAGRLDIDRISVYRWEREPHRMNPEKQEAYAEALGIEPEDLWRPPNRPSVDALLRGASDDVLQKAAEIVSIMVKTGT